ncbi:restriction endonuclease subunit S [Nostoc sp. UHCC 0702]|nr:restriction endonuclease subunit S [Nostoc sp. UHCC 0702]
MSVWEIKKLGEVIKLEYGKPLPKESREEGGKYPAYGANGVKCWSNQYYLDRQSIIVGRKGSAGEVNLTDEKFWPLDVTYFVTYDDTQYDLTFLYHCLKYLRLTKLAKGVKPGINRNDVYQIEFAFPPLPEQKRIVAILDEAFEGIDRAIANTEKNLANARELFESYLNAIFTQKGDRWVEKKLADICSITSKLVDPRLPEYIDLPHLGAGNMVSMTGELIEVKTAREEELKSGKFLFDETMVLYSKIRPYLMKACRPEFSGLCSVDVYPLLPNNGQLNRDFLFYLLMSRNFTDYAISGSDRAGMPKVNRDHLFRYSTWIPSLSEQINIAQKIDEIATKTQRLEAIYRQKIAALNELKQSILQKAFTGELTADTANQLTKAAKEGIAA